MSSSNHSTSLPNSNNSLSPTKHVFTPRPEFLSSSIVSQRHEFALLTLSASSSLRLYSFPTALISSVRALLTSRNLIHAVRETDHQNMIEFTLHGKLWTQPKAVPTERLIVDLLGVMYKAGWAYVSTVDYGREHDDRLAMTFRRAGDDLGRINEKQALIPFALSFPNATLLRVVGPPLHSTPAILAAVRGSWPRGVVNEKKVGEGVYEFKLKGYRWFEEDTFATDSLTHILGLLASLDAHGFSLLTSICLANSRSRVKDLWIFTGPPAPDSPSGSTYAVTASPVLGHQKMPSLPIPLSPVSSLSTNGHAHARAATAPAATPQPRPVQQPVVAPPPPVVPPPSSPRTMRKPAPRAQIPISVISNSSDIADTGPDNKPAPRAQVPVSIIDYDTGPTDHERPRTGDLPPFGSPTRNEFGVRPNIPSRVSEGVEDMAGVGTTIGQKTPDVFYTTSPFAPNTQANEREHDGDSFYGAEGRQVEQDDHPGQFGNEQQEEEPRISNILHPNAFRSMALTSGSRSASDNSYPSPALERGESEMSRDIPVAWTGRNEPNGELLVPPPPPLDTRMSSTPFFPGAWAPTPVQELPIDEPQEPIEPEPSQSIDEPVNPNAPVHNNEARVASPTITAPQYGRKSEAGLVVTLEDGEWKKANVSTSEVPRPLPMPQHSPPVPPLPAAAQHVFNGGNAAPPMSPVGGQGWVMVDVAGQTTSPTSPHPSAPVPPTENRSLSPGHRHQLDEQAALSPSAKAIAMVDAVQEREKDRNEPSVSTRSKITSSPKAHDSTSSISSPTRSNSNASSGGVRRFLSLSSPRKDKDKEGDKKGFRNRLRKWA